MKLTKKLLILVVFTTIPLFGIQTTNAQTVDSFNQVETLEDDSEIEDLNSIKAIKKNYKKKRRVKTKKKNTLRNRKVASKTKKNTKEFEEALQKLANWHHQGETRDRDPRKCFRDTEEEDSCDSDEDENEKDM